MSAVSTPAEGLDLGAAVEAAAKAILTDLTGFKETWTFVTDAHEGLRDMATAAVEAAAPIIAAPLLAEVERLREEVKRAAERGWDEGWRQCVVSQGGRTEPRVNPYRAQGIEGRDA